jgi:hypothetical protein
MKNLIWFVLLLVGCSESATELTAWQKAMRDGSVDVIEKQDETMSLLKDNTAALTRIEAKLEASLSAPKPQTGKDGDPASAQKPPAKANTPNCLSKSLRRGLFALHQTAHVCDGTSTAIGTPRFSRPLHIWAANMASTRTA